MQFTFVFAVCVFARYIGSTLYLYSASCLAVHVIVLLYNADLRWHWLKENVPSFTLVLAVCRGHLV